ncbi:MAG: transcriptional regulator [Candidatus Bathyarchaeota archaeon]|nr:transcriptional regulator [Candidatus Bathyarchaeota archaeon]
MVSRQNTIVAVSLVLVLAVLGGFALLKPTEEKAKPTGPWTIIRPPSDVTCMVPIGDTLWVGGKLGIVGVKLQGFEVVDFPYDVKLSYVRHMIVDGDALLVGHDNGLTVFSGSTYRTYTAADGLVDGRVNYLLISRSGELWVGTTQGAYHKSGDQWLRVTTQDGLLSDQVNVMLEDGNGGLWFGSDVAPLGGISILKDGTWTHFTTDNGLPHNDVNSFYMDHDGSVWAATGLLDVGGAVHFVEQDGVWVISEVLTVKDGLPEGKVRSVYRDPSGVLWIGSENAGLARIEAGRIRVFAEAQGLSHSEVKVLWTDSSGNLWLGTRNGVTVLSPEDQRKMSLG